MSLHREKVLEMQGLGVNQLVNRCISVDAATVILTLAYIQNLQDFPRMVGVVWRARAMETQMLLRVRDRVTHNRN